MTVRRGLAAVWATVAVLAVVVLGPAGALLLLAVALGGRAAAVRSARRRRAAAEARAVPELVDLFLLAASAGLPVGAALAAVAARAPPPVRPVLGRAQERTTQGVALADALAELGAELGPSAAELVDALAHAARTGAPLVPALERVAALSRDRRTRAAEAAARRLPVTLLFPLACCVLPAAVLLAVVPVVAGSLSSLDP